MTDLDLLDRLLGRHLADGRGEATAYVDAEGRIGYAELYRAVRWYAARLAAAGIPPGSPGLVVADDAIPTVVAILALWWRGMVAVPVSPLLTVAELEFLAADCRARYLHLDARAAAATPAQGALDVPRGGPDWAAPVEFAPPPPAAPPPAEVVLIQYTSGSTGVPKGVLHTGSGIAAVLDGFGRILDLAPDDRVLSTAKLSFGYGFGNSLLFPLAAGASAVLNPGPPDVYAVGAAVDRHRPTVLCAVPRIYAALLDRAGAPERADLGSLRLAVSAGEHLPAAVCADFTRTFGVPLINGLGATEVLHIVVATRGTEPGSTGTAVPGARVTVRDDDGREVPDGTEGRLHVGGASVAAGYLDRPEAAARTFVAGGAYTGDVVRRGPDGRIGYVCRRDDLLNIGGFKVSPFEIEATARDVPGLAQCAVVGSRDARGLEQAVAYVVPADGADREEVRGAARAAFRRGLPPHKRPVAVEVVDELPTTSTGKLARYRLRAAPVPTPRDPAAAGSAEAAEPAAGEAGRSGPGGA
ncbi:AMP-binding protein [Plantactinospora siamensis]|uniref:AMP-binding protein n=1 Tax=Plantactinospora siamensis TaxID=555372 RepID=A0ABV6NUQ1_9ACTN